MKTLSIHRPRLSMVFDKHLAGRSVHDRDRVKELAPHGQIGHVGAPDMVGLFDREFAQQIGINPVLRA